QEVGVGLALEPAGVAAVAGDLLGVGLARREHHLVGVHDDHVVAGVDVGGEDRLVLAPQDASGLGAHAPQHHAVGIDDVPGALDLARFRGVRTHTGDFLCAPRRTPGRGTTKGYEPPPPPTSAAPYCCGASSAPTR